MSDRVNVAVLGASGYTGAELLRLGLEHPRLHFTTLTADRSAGKSMADVFPQFHGFDLPDLIRIDDVDWGRVDAVFCALPHGTTQEVIAALPRHLFVVDLSADFRLADTATYAAWYGHDHRAPELQPQAVYGLTEINRERIRLSRLVANPGCYPTSAQLPLVPLIEAGLVSTDDIVVDSKSGVSGAGREAKQQNLFGEVAEGIHAYGVAAHRHTPEIEQGLTLAAGRSVRVTFTPHLMPMSRGILSTIYVKLAPRADASTLRNLLARRYEREPFVHVLPQGQSPQTRHVRGTNICRIAVFDDRVTGRAIVLSAIDNLTKGASGQAIQNLNVMMGIDETAGLRSAALFP